MIRAARVDDIADLCALERAAFPGDAPISARSFRNLVRSTLAEVVLIDDAGEFVGAAVVTFSRRSRIARLYSIGVMPAHRGRGYGGRLLAVAEKCAIGRRSKAMRLEVRESNGGAIALYRARGYAQFGRRDHYYEDGEGALRFEKRLAPGGILT